MHTKLMVATIVDLSLLLVCIVLSISVQNKLYF